MEARQKAEVCARSAGAPFGASPTQCTREQLLVHVQLSLPLVGLGEALCTRNDRSRFDCLMTSHCNLCLRDLHRSTLHYGHSLIENCVCSTAHRFHHCVKRERKGKTCNKQKKLNTVKRIMIRKLTLQRPYCLRLSSLKFHSDGSVNFRGLKNHQNSLLTRMHRIRNCLDFFSKPLLLLKSSLPTNTTIGNQSAKKKLSLTSLL